MSNEPLNLLVLTDLHHAPCEGATFFCPERERIAGPLLLNKALRRMRHAGTPPDALVLLGDAAGRYLDAAQTDAALRAVAEEAKRSGLPVLAVPGNHDGDLARYAELFGCQPGLHVIKGYGLLLFSAEYDEADNTRRGDDELALPARCAAEHPGLPLIALQHNPLHPAIDDPYPYVPKNADAIRGSYEKAGVLLSLSGHFHPGQPLHTVGGVQYCTLRAAGDAPYCFLHVRVAGNSVEVREHALYAEAPGLVDVHCHTEYSYCATTVSAAADVALSRLLGLGGVCLVDHTFQLYFPPEEAWSWRWQTDRGMVEDAWRRGRGRMPEYVRRAAGLRSEFVRVGLELDLLSDGSLLLAEEDRRGWDLFIGAIHAIDGNPRGGRTPGEVERLFMRENERLLAHPINVLAHPLRFFRQSGLTCPSHLFAPLADMLAAAGVAAEINFHVQEADALFFEACLERGVKLALGTDAHDAAETAELMPHLALLRRVGVSDFDRVLFRP
jgi:histidinol phosphatase-like PHP family hydrolase